MAVVPVRTGRGGVRPGTCQYPPVPTSHKGFSMLNIPGPRSTYCDGISRRSFLKAGTFAFGATAFNMVDVLRAETVRGSSAPHKAVINIYLGGGPAHQDMWEIKTE